MQVSYEEFGPETKTVGITLVFLDTQTPSQPVDVPLGGHGGYKVKDRGGARVYAYEDKQKLRVIRVWPPWQEEPIERRRELKEGE